MDEETTQRMSVELDDNAGIIDLFVTITGITPVPDIINENDNSSIASDVLPSKLSEQDLEKYVRTDIGKEIFTFFVFRHFYRL